MDSTAVTEVDDLLDELEHSLHYWSSRRTQKDVCEHCGCSFADPKDPFHHPEVDLLVEVFETGLPISSQTRRQWKNEIEGKR